MDARSHVVHDGKKFKKSDILQVRLIFVTQEGKNFLPTGFASSDFLLTGSAANMFFLSQEGRKLLFEGLCTLVSPPLLPGNSGGRGNRWWYIAIWSDHDCDCHHCWKVSWVLTPSSNRSPGPLLVNVVVLSDVVLFLQVEQMHTTTMSHNCHNCIIAFDLNIQSHIINTKIIPCWAQAIRCSYAGEQPEVHVCHPGRKTRGRPSSLLDCKGKARIRVAEGDFHKTKADHWSLHSQLILKNRNHQLKIMLLRPLFEKNSSIILIFLSKALFLLSTTGDSSSPQCYEVNTQTTSLYYNKENYQKKPPPPTP